VIGAYPPTLVALGDPEVRAFLRAVDPTPDSPAGSGSQDWAVLADRMHFIADLFRTRHEDATLFAPPFSEAALRAMDENRVPDGPV
jgi:hypothetical protein